MPLTRATVTIASRIMLPTYVVFFTAVGLSLLVTTQRRLHETPAFRYADTIADLDLWGLGFLTIATGLALALLVHRREVYRWFLAAGCIWMSVFAVVTFLAALFGSASYSAWIWSGFVAAACWATLCSLAAGER